MKTFDALNRLAKWRSVFAGWQLGTRPKGDAECNAVRDHRELSMLLRAEVTALVGLLVQKKVFSSEEFATQLAQEAELLSQAYERQFPGFHATDEGIQMELPQAQETMRRLNFRP